MILYNTTYTFDSASQHEWLYWMRSEHIPAVMNTGLPLNHRLLRLVSDVGQQGVVVSFQLDFASMADYQLFSDTYTDLLSDRMQFRFAGKLASFSTVLEEI